MKQMDASGGTIRSTWSPYNVILLLYTLMSCLSNHPSHFHHTSLHSVVPILNASVSQTFQCRRSNRTAQAEVRPHHHLHSRSTTLAARSAAYRIQSVCPGVQMSASGCTNIPCWTVLIVSESASCGHLRSAGRTTLQNNEIRPKMFRCFQTNLVELTPFDNSWPITDTDSVLCAFENCVIL